MKIDFNEATHIYMVNGKKVPSVTEILAPLHRSFGAINPSVLDYAAKRGTAVHESLEMLDLTGDLEWTPEITPYVQAYLEWYQVYKPTWTAVEKVVFCEELWYAGTLDRMGLLNGTERAIVDLKTSQDTKEALVSVCVQTAAYTLALSETDEGARPRRYGLFLRKNGTWRFQDCEEYERKYGFNGFEIFRSLLKNHKMISKLLEKGSKKDE